MKKLFTVLAVLLVASVAFAGFSGSLTAKYTFDFDAKSISYDKPQVGKPGAGFDVSFAWDSQSLTIGEEDGVHMEVAAHAGFEGWYLQKADHAEDYDPIVATKGEWVWKLAPATDYFEAGVKLKVNTFKIVAENWTVDFLGSAALDFAKSAIDTKKFNGGKLEENVQNYTLDNSVKGEHNLAVTAYGYKFGFGLGSTAWDNAVTFALTGVTPEYDFNGVKAQFGAGYQVKNCVWNVAASAKASYAADKWSISGAYDMIADKDFVKDEVAVAFGFAPVAVDVYFNNEGAVAKDKFYDYMDNQDDHKASLPSNYLSAKVVVDVAKVAENVPVTVTLTGKNLINEDKQIVSVSATTTVVPNFKFGAYFNDWFDNETSIAADNNNRQKLGATVEFTGVEKLTLNAEVAYKFAKGNDAAKRLYVNAGAAYAADLFTASATVSMEKPYDADAIFGAVVGAKSTTLVAGAELSAKARFNLNNLAELDTTATNDLTLACKVSF